MGANGEKHHKLNFPETPAMKRKRTGSNTYSDDFMNVRFVPCTESAVKCPNNHALEQLTTKVADYDCDGCGNYCRSPFMAMFGCRKCDFDLCENCKNFHKNKKNSYRTYKSELAAARASDALVRKLMKNGEKGHKLNYPGDDTELHGESKCPKNHALKRFKTMTTHYGCNKCGMSVDFPKGTTMYGCRKCDFDLCENCNNLYKVYPSSKKRVHFSDEEKALAARESDALARKLMENDLKKTHPSSKYIGVKYDAERRRWEAQRWSSKQNKMVHGGFYFNEANAARESDSLARDLMENGEQHKLNFPFTE